MNRVMFCAGAILVAALSFTAAAALAATPADQVYGGEGGNVTQGVGGEVGRVGTLPFTGLDLLLTAVAAALLIGAGVTIRRLARAKA